MERRLDTKEAAVRERRVWIRLTRRCNNGCLFCLDADSLDGTTTPGEEVERQIRRGRAEGGERLILSGGEPTLHPDYLRFLALGRDLGYTWRQTVSNGRMFAYRKFADAAVEAGLCEATFSMHAHTEELHDRLVGVPGAFRQSLAGLRNLVGRIVVNVDVVLSRVNLPHLREILDFYIGQGIHEFDLLHMVPFGRAWSENRELLFYDPAAMAPHFRRAFEVRRNKGIVIWTNRLPARFLEGNEDLIQDPHKLHDEVRGRMAMFQEWRDGGRLPICLGERCPHCPMEGFCQALQEALSMAPPTPPNSQVS
ncbi:MAG: radical SAM protein, partial [Deltaproteobacteria bacterium]|nr:radical SAM protein [Deltaproteobacteria bacterium]